MKKPKQARTVAAGILTIGVLCPFYVDAQVLMNPNEIVSSNDYTSYNEGRTEYRLTLARNGRPISCEVVKSSGHADLDQKTCNLTVERSVFDMSQVPAAAIMPSYRSSIKWTRGITGPRAASNGLTAKQSTSEVDPRKTRCEFSDGEVAFVTLGASCFAQTAQVAPAASSITQRGTGHGSQVQACRSLGFRVGTPEYSRCKQDVAMGILATHAAGNLESAAKSGSSRQGTNASNARPASNSATPALANDERSNFIANLEDARAGNASEFVNVARRYMFGRGTPPDSEKAIFWMRKAENLQIPDAFETLAYWYMLGTGLKQDYQISFEYINKYKLSRPSISSLSILEEFLKGRVGSDGYSCLEYGFTYKTPAYSMCNLQMAQAKKQAEQQADIARQQAEIAQARLDLEHRKYEQQQLAAVQAQQRAQQAERDRSRQETSDALMALSADLLCPKKTRGFMAEPVAGCGRNKNEPRAPTVNVYVEQQNSIARQLLFGQ